MTDFALFLDKNIYKFAAFNGVYRHARRDAWISPTTLIIPHPTFTAAPWPLQLAARQSGI